jgi:hypothetical protein
MLLVCLGTGSVMKTRPVWEQGESTQLLVVSHGSRLEGYFDCCRFTFQDASFSVSSITALSQFIVPVLMLLEPNIICLL